MRLPRILERLEEAARSYYTYLEYGDLWDLNGYWDNNYYVLSSGERAAASLVYDRPDLMRTEEAWTAMDAGLLKEVNDYLQLNGPLKSYAPLTSRKHNELRLKRATTEREKLLEQISGLDDEISRLRDIVNCYSLELTLPAKVR